MSEFKLPPFFIVFDVETVGLYGEPFALGVVIVNTATWATEVEALVGCPFQRAGGVPEDRAWVEENVLPALQAQMGTLRPREVETPDHLRNVLADLWEHWSARGAWLAADHPFPVETEFLSGMWVERKISAKADVPSPYPLFDYANFRAGRGLDPIETLPREESELPAHNPLADARQTARLIAELFR